MGREELLKLLPMTKLPVYLDEVETLMLATADSAVFREQIAKIIRRRGKRLRPMLVIAGARLSGRPINKRVIAAAAAIELIHQASLVHDDIIDGDSTMSPHLALLIGDYLISAGLGQAAAVSPAATGILSNAIMSMAEGQQQQMTDRYRVDVSDKFYIDTVKNKTAALFSAACQLGSLGTPSAEPLHKYGQAFGAAFQIIDDITDQDFEPEHQSSAKRTAQRYNRLAKSALRTLPNSPLKDGLARLPGIYLDIALS